MFHQKDEIEIRLHLAQQPLYETVDRQVLTTYQDHAKVLQTEESQYDIYVVAHTEDSRFNLPDCRFLLEHKESRHQHCSSYAS